MFKAVSRQNAARFQRPPAARVRAAVLSVLHKLKLSQMSCGINGSFNPQRALIRTAPPPRSVLINSKWFCGNFGRPFAKKIVSTSSHLYSDMCGAGAGPFVMNHFKKLLNSIPPLFVFSVLRQ